jgi:hypothetical protein
MEKELSPEDIRHFILRRQSLIQNALNQAAKEESYGALNPELIE